MSFLHLYVLILAKLSVKASRFFTNLYLVIENTAGTMAI